MKKLFLIAFLFCAAKYAIAQNVGIGTTTPVAKLHVADSSVLFSGPTYLPATAGLPPVSGTGNRLMWYARKAAFRVGGTTGNAWDDTYIGKYSAALGLSNRAAGMYATSMGYANSSSGMASFSTGYSNTSGGYYSAAFGENVDATAYASLVIGRYNLQAGNYASWVDTDPLFVVGNGYTYEVSPGIGAIQRRNAFSIDKTGNTIINGKLNVNGNTMHTGQTLLNGYTTMFGGMENYGPTKLRDITVMTDTLLVTSNSPIQAFKTGGTTPMINLVPIGVVEFEVIYERTVLLDDCSSTYTNLAGSIIASRSSFCEPGVLFQDGKVGINLIFNTAQVAPYTKVIAVPSITFQGIGNSGNTQLSKTSSKITVDDVTQKPKFYTATFSANEIPSIGTFSVSGTVMFYGLK